MELLKASDRIYYSTFETERDRPSLGYVRGDDWSLAVDAGHSDAHVEEFYAALQQAGLPLPSLTVLTHWHWDHTFGMHRAHGLCAANAVTNRYLREFSEKVQREETEVFLSLDESIRKEYAGGRPVVIVPADIEFDETLELFMGGVRACLMPCVSPHTDDTTLVYIPEEKFLFLGDSPSGVFPTWERDPEKTRCYMHALEKIDADRCLGGHWPLMTKKDLLEALERDAI